MAELGLAVGIAGFAIQVGDKILKLKALVDDVKEAPEEIKYIITEMNVLRQLLSECSTSIKDIPGDNTTAIASQCEELCRHGAEILAKIVNEMEREIRESKLIGSFKVVARKGTLDRMRQRVRDARDMLQLSRVLYSEAVQKYHNQHLLQLVLQLQVDRTKSSDSISSLSSNFSACTDEPLQVIETIGQLTLIDKSPSVNSQIHSRADGCKRSSNSGWNSRLKFPSWLQVTSRGIEVCCFPTKFSYGLDFRVYNEVAWDSEVVCCVRNGDVAGIRRLFNTGMASPFDRALGSFSLVKIAASSQQLEVCRLLLGLPLSVEIDRVGRLYCLKYLLWQVVKNTENIALLDLLVQKDEVADPLHSDPFSYWGHSPIMARTNAKGLEWAIKKTRSRYFQRTDKERGRIILNLAGFKAQPDLASMVRFLLDKDPINLELCLATVRRGPTLLHCVARTLGETYVHSPATFEAQLRKQKAEDPACHYRLQELLRLLRDLIDAGSRLHSICQDTWTFGRQTPLTAIIQGTAISNRGICSRSAMHKFDGVPDQITKGSITMAAVPLMLWIEELWRAGVDLVEYGRREREAWSSGRVWDTFTLDVWDEDRVDTTTTEYSMMFTYGPKPSNWEFLFIEQLNSFFREFWAMVDHPEWAFSIPGAWEDDTYRSVPYWELPEYDSESDDSESENEVIYQ